MSIQDSVYDTFYKASFSVLKKQCGLSSTANMDMNIFKIGNNTHCVWSHAKENVRYFIVFDKKKLARAFKIDENGKRTDILQSKKDS